MKTIRLDVRHIHTVKALHIYLQYMLDYPAYYGRNLDALHDMLCQESEAMRIELAGSAECGGELEAYMPRLVRVMQDAAKENARIEIAVV